MHTLAVTIVIPFLQYPPGFQSDFVSAFCLKIESFVIKIYICHNSFCRCVNIFILYLYSVHYYFTVIDLMTFPLYVLIGVWYHRGGLFTKLFKYLTSFLASSCRNWKMGTRKLVDHASWVTYGITSENAKSVRNS